MRASRCGEIARQTAELLAIRPDGHRDHVWRTLVPEAPVALEYNGISYAVMMATPTDLEDFARGFALTEGLATGPDDVAQIMVAEVATGWVVRTVLPGLPPGRLYERVRTRAAESSCGLCGIENLEQLARPLPPVAPHPALAPSAVFAALAMLRPLQTLGQATGAAHAAAWADPQGTITCLREDVGRHNALDKLVGAMAGGGQTMGQGFVISTARCSYEIVEKTVRAGATSLVTISLPTDLATRRARDAGLSLWVLAREDAVLLVCEGRHSRKS